MTPAEVEEAADLLRERKLIPRIEQAKWSTSGECSFIVLGNIPLQDRLQEAARDWLYARQVEIEARLQQLGVTV